MRKNVRARFWIETGLASLTAGLFLLTLVWRDWIEAAFGFSPDHHNGSLEWIVVGVLFLATAALIALARSEWRRPALAN
jgi:hypothetical protein